MVEPPDCDTPNEVLVAQSSADSVSQPLSGPLLGFGGYVGSRSGPTVIVGQSGSVPLTLIEICRESSIRIGGGGPGGRTPSGKLNTQPRMFKSPN